MSERITEKWTENIEDAFENNKKLKKGIKAEELFLKYALENYGEANHYISDRDKQNSGIDIDFLEDGNFVGVDVKATLLQNGSFPVENNSSGWIRNPKKQNKYVVHINVDDQRAIQYDRESMIKYLDKIIRSKDDLVWLQFDDFEFDGESPPLIYKKYWIN